MVKSQFGIYFQNLKSSFESRISNGNLISGSHFQILISKSIFPKSQMEIMSRNLDSKISNGDSYSRNLISKSQNGN